MFMPFTFNPKHDGLLYDYLINSMARAQSVDDKAVFVFVGDANAHHYEWLESVSPADRHGRDTLNFVICQVVSSWCVVLLTLMIIDSFL